MASSGGHNKYEFSSISPAKMKRSEQRSNMMELVGGIDEEELAQEVCG